MSGSGITQLGRLGQRIFGLGDDAARLSDEAARGVTGAGDDGLRIGQSADDMIRAGTPEAPVVPPNRFVAAAERPPFDRSALSAPTGDAYDDIMVQLSRTPMPEEQLASWTTMVNDFTASVSHLPRNVQDVALGHMRRMVQLNPNYGGPTGYAARSGNGFDFMVAQPPPVGTVGMRLTLEEGGVHFASTGASYGEDALRLSITTPRPGGAFSGAAEDAAFEITGSAHSIRSLLGNRHAFGGALTDDFTDIRALNDFDPSRRISVGLDETGRVNQPVRVVDSFGSPYQAGWPQRPVSLGEFVERIPPWAQGGNGSPAMMRFAREYMDIFVQPGHAREAVVELGSRIAQAPEAVQGPVLAELAAAQGPLSRVLSEGVEYGAFTSTNLGTDVTFLFPRNGQGLSFYRSSDGYRLTNAFVDERGAQIGSPRMVVMQGTDESWSAVTPAADGSWAPYPFSYTPLR